MQANIKQQKHCESKKISKKIQKIGEGREGELLPEINFPTDYERKFLEILFIFYTTGTYVFFTSFFQS